MMGDITKNFSRKEFTCKCGCGLNVIDERLVHRLQVIRDIVQEKMIISSGCRCVDHNQNVGGASVSYHLAGWAADWHFPLDCSDNLYYEVATLLKDWSGGIHYYKDKRFFHCDIGNIRCWG